MGMSDMKDYLFWAWWGWEPLLFYRYAKSQAVGIAGVDPASLDHWYELLHSEKTVAAAADLGINRAITHFIKGFGLQYEKKEIARTTELTALCHQYGIKVFGYLQYGSIFYETFFREFPQAANWIKLDESGQAQYWCNSPQRYLPCINAPEHHDYLRTCIRLGLEEVGLDGLHFDNFYSRPCYCKRCREEFKAYSGADIPSEAALEVEPYQDPVLQQWIRFRCDRLNQLMEQLRDYARSLKPEVEIIWNPSPIRGVLNQTALRGADFRQLGTRADFLWSESGNFPGYRDGKLIHQVNFFKTAETIGYRTFSTTWKHSTEGHGLTKTPEEVALNTAESAAFAATPGSNWLLRPSHIQDLLNSGPLSQELKRYFDFIRQHLDLLADSHAEGEVAVFLDQESVPREFSRSYGTFLAVQDLLLRHHITFDLLFQEQVDKVQNYQTIIRISNQQGQWQPHFSGQVIEVDAAAYPINITGSYQAAILPVPEMEELLKQLLKTLGQREFEFTAPDTLLLEARRAADKRRILHCLNYNNCHTCGKTKLQFAHPPTRLHFFAPEGNGLLTADNGTFPIPEIKTWLILAWHDYQQA